MFEEDKVVLIDESCIQDVINLIYTDSEFIDFTRQLYILSDCLVDRFKGITNENDKNDYLATYMNILSVFTLFSRDHLEFIQDLIKTMKFRCVDRDKWNSDRKTIEDEYLERLKSREKDE